MDGTTQLAVAELVIYLIFVQFALFLLYKHGRHGLEGWFFLVTFCVLRIIAAALQINNWNKIKKGEPSSDTASIINSVGVSALLLCACGLIHEASTYEYNHDRKLGWILVLLNHIAVGAGIALSAVGGSNLAEAKTHSDRDTDKGLLIAGYFIILAAMIGELVYAGRTLLSLRRTGPPSRSSASRSAQTLIYAVIAAVVILLARVIYSIVYGFTLNPSLSPYTGSLAIKVVLIFLVQFIAALIIAVAGFVTRNIAHNAPVHHNGIANGHEPVSDMK